MSRVPQLPALAWPRSGGVCLAPLEHEEGKVFTVRSALASPGYSRRRSAPFLLSARPGVPTSFGEVLAGSFSIARRLDAGASFAPSPRLAPSLFPHHTPTPRRRHANRRSLSWALAVPAPFFWRPGLAGGGRAQPLPATPDRGRWKLH